MMITTPSRSAAKPCSCGGDTCCHTGPLERPRYFPRQVVTATELTLEFEYLRERDRRHNRLLHGWGVVCGAEVCQTTDQHGAPVPWKVTIQPGFALGPCGDEIAIDCERVVDLRTTGLTCVTGMPPGEVSDPWCGDARVERAGKVCIGIQYREFPARPVRVHPVGCGCGGDDCEYSRWRDGYEIGLLPDCPEDRHRPSRFIAPAPPATLPPPGGTSGTSGTTPTPGATTPPGTGSAGFDLVHPAPPMPTDMIGDEGVLSALGMELEARGLSVGNRHRAFQCPPCPPTPWVVLACVKLDSKGIATIDACDCRRYVVSLSAITLCWDPPTSHAKGHDEVMAIDDEAAEEPRPIPAKGVASRPPGPLAEPSAAPESAPKPARARSAGGSSGGSGGSGGTRTAGRSTGSSGSSRSGGASTGGTDSSGARRRPTRRTR